MTSEPLGGASFDPSISSAGEARARIFPSRARVLASKVLAAVYGSSTRESLANFDHDSSSWKTSQLSLLADSTESSAVFPRSGMTRSGSLSELPTLERLTDGSGYSSWPTPRAYSHGDSNTPGLTTLDIRVRGMYEDNPRYWPTPMVPNGGRSIAHAEMIGGTFYADGKKVQLDLAAAVRTWPTPRNRDWKGGGKDCLDSAVAMWPTPRAEHDSGAHAGKPDTMHSAIKMFPTPTAADGSRGSATMMRGNPTLKGAAQGSVTAPLNPAWVEALMGFPAGWTDGPPDPPKRSTSGNRRARRQASSVELTDSKPSETPLCPPAPKSSDGSSEE